ncbi:unnamed protein product, partial [Ectocarpus sp. 12 AP-2014]
MYDRLLVPVDLGDISSLDNALPVAAALATGANAEVHVLAVIPTAGMAVVSSYLPDDYAEKAMADARDRLSTALEEKSALCGPVTLKGHVTKGSVYQEIIHTADALKCDAIVM